MPESTETTETAPAAALAQATPKTVVEFDPTDAVATYMNTAVFAQLQRVGKMMAASSLVPDMMKGKEADCALVAAQAFRWRMDPIAVAAHTFVYKGKLGYEGKLVAALVNSAPKLVANLKPIYSGTKGEKSRKVVIIGRLRGENEDREVDGTVGEWATDNENWRKDPDQMLFYRGAREWARRHMPELLLGVLADEEVETITLTRTSEDGFAGVAAVDRKPALSGLDQVTERLRQSSAMAAPVGDPVIETRPVAVETKATEKPARTVVSTAGCDGNHAAPACASPGCWQKGPPPCEHTACPPSRIARLSPGTSIECPDCNETFRGPEPKTTGGQDAAEQGGDRDGSAAAVAVAGSSPAPPATNETTPAPAKKGGQRKLAEV